MHLIYPVLFYKFVSETGFYTVPVVDELVLSLSYICDILYLYL